jgi:predicted PurR-regulated permease PerM
MPPADTRSPNWSLTTKVFVAALALILLGMAIWYFQSLIGPLVIAGMLAYILNPLIVWLDDYTPLGRGVAIGIVYGLFVLVVLGVLTAAGVTIYQQGYGLIWAVQGIIRDGPELIQSLVTQPIRFGNWTLYPDQLNLDISLVWQQLASAIQPIITQSAQVVGTAATTTATGIGWAIIIFVISIYFAVDLPRFGNLIRDAIYQPGYRRDVARILSEVGRIWDGYLRGQTILAVLTAVTFTVLLTILGVRYALVLGILAGMLTFIPFIGPFIIVTLSTLVAIFQGDNWVGLSPIWFGVVVLLVGLIFHQVVGNWLNPYIVGGVINLHPLVVMVGAIMGSIMAGILGVILAAPVIATVKLLGTYAWRKMFDLDPFPEPEPNPEPEPEPVPWFRSALVLYHQLLHFHHQSKGRFTKE